MWKNPKNWILKSPSTPPPLYLHSSTIEVFSHHMNFSNNIWPYKIGKTNPKFIDLNPEVYLHYSGGVEVDWRWSGGRLQDSILWVFSHHMTSSNNIWPSKIAKTNPKLIDLNPEVYLHYSGGVEVEWRWSGGRLQDSILWVFSHHMTSSNNIWPSKIVKTNPKLIDLNPEVTSTIVEVTSGFKSMSLR